MLKPAFFFPPLQSTLGVDYVNVWKRKDVLIYSSLLDEAAVNLKKHQQKTSFGDLQPNRSLFLGIKKCNFAFKMPISSPPHAN